MKTFNNWKIIYIREKMKYNNFIFLLGVSLVISAIILFIVINNMIITTKQSGLINYDNINNIISIVYVIIFVIYMYLAVYFFSNSINRDIDNLFIINVLNTRIKLIDIIIGKYIEGLETIFTLFVCAVPIYSLIYTFGGIRVLFVLKYIFLLFLSICFMSILCMLISSIFREIFMSRIICHILFILFMILFIYYYKYIINSFAIYIIIVFFMLLSIPICFILINMSNLYKK